MKKSLESLKSKFGQFEIKAHSERYIFEKIEIICFSPDESLLKEISLFVISDFM